MGERTALVTGGNRGIGLAIVEGLAKAGLRVLLGARDPAAGEVAAQQLQRDHDLPTRVVEMDVGMPDSIQAAVRALERDGLAVDVLVNNAGVLPDGDMLTMPWDDIERSTRINALGPLYLIRLLTPGMVQRGYGRVVNVSSEWGSLNDLGPGAYGITKAYLNAMTVKAARELPRSIKVNAMCPGWVQTRMGGAGAERTPAQGADTAIFLATLPDDGPTGALFRDRRPIRWDA